MSAPDADTRNVEFSNKEFAPVPDVRPLESGTPAGAANLSPGGPGPQLPSSALREARGGKAASALVLVGAAESSKASRSPYTPGTPASGRGRQGAGILSDGSDGQRGARHRKGLFQPDHPRAPLLCKHAFCTSPWNGGHLMYCDAHEETFLDIAENWRDE